MCNCFSYNWDDPKDKSKDESVLLIVPEIIWNYMDSHSGYICVDKCIVKVIEHLWKNYVVTLGSCCGHNRTNPSVIVRENCPEKEVEKIREIIAEVDDRDWEICTWRTALFKYKKGRLPKFNYEDME